MPPRARTIVVPHPHLLGRTVTLARAATGRGGRVARRRCRRRRVRTRPSILLPKSEVPPGTKVGDELTVFVTLDSEDRPLATTRIAEAAARRGRVPRRHRHHRRSAPSSTGACRRSCWSRSASRPATSRSATATRSASSSTRPAASPAPCASARCCGRKPVVAVDEWVAGEAWRDGSRDRALRDRRAPLRRRRPGERAARPRARRGGDVPRHPRPPRRQVRALAPRQGPRGARRRRAARAGDPGARRHARRSATARAPRRSAPSSASARRPSSAPSGGC